MTPPSPFQWASPLPHGLEELGSAGFICSFHVAETFLASSLALTGGGLVARTPLGPQQPFVAPSALVNLETPASRDHQSQHRHPGFVTSSQSALPLTPQAARWEQGRSSIPHARGPTPEPHTFPSILSPCAYRTLMGRPAPPVGLCLAAPNLGLFPLGKFRLQ